MASRFPYASTVHLLFRCFSSLSMSIKACGLSMPLALYRDTSDTRSCSPPVFYLSIVGLLYEFSMFKTILFTYVSTTSFSDWVGVWLSTTGVAAATCLGSAGGAWGYCVKWPRRFFFSSRSIFISHIGFGAPISSFMSTSEIGGELTRSLFLGISSVFVSLSIFIIRCFIFSKYNFIFLRNIMNQKYYFWDFEKNNSLFFLQN